VKRDAVTVGQRMLPAHHDREPASLNEFPLHLGEPGQGGYLMNERHLQPAVAELGEQPLAYRDGAVKHDARVPGVKGGERRGDRVLGQHGHPGPDHPGLAPAHTANLLHRIFGIREQAASIIHELQAGLGELDAMRRPLEQLHIERSLQLGD
jgi:hypothetical protein